LVRSLQVARSDESRELLRSNACPKRLTPADRAVLPARDACEIRRTFHSDPLCGRDRTYPGRSRTETWGRGVVRPRM